MLGIERLSSILIRAPDDDGCVRALSVDLRAPVKGGVRLAGDEVHLEWGTRDAVESLDALRAWLSDDERRRSERFRREQDAQRFVFRRAFLRAALAARLGCLPGELAFVPGEFGFSWNQFTTEGFGENRLD